MLLVLSFPTMPSLTESVELAPSGVTSDEPLSLQAEGWIGPTTDPLVPGSIEALDLATILHALSDPIRLRIVAQLADGNEYTCGSFDLPIAKSTCSHHFRVLREAGVVAQRIDGKCRFNRIRAAELEQRFPGLLRAVLQASRP